jgi:diadenosine tetraphosphate (Ap4A) HIT family hydrolase
VVEHAYPTSLLGWLVIVLKRHAEALHELSHEEGEELGLLQWAVSRALSAEIGCMKEYAVFFAEQPGFSHVHVHMVPRAADLDAALLGGRVFAHLTPRPSEVIDPSDVARFCERVGGTIRAELAARVLTGR